MYKIGVKVKYTKNPNTKNDKDVFKSMQKISASRIMEIERWIERRNGILSPVKTKTNIVKEYELYKAGGHYTGDPNKIFNHLKEKYPTEDWDRFSNHDGKALMRVIYALLYGEAPIRIIQPPKNVNTDKETGN